MNDLDRNSVIEFLHDIERDVMRSGGKMSDVLKRAGIRSITWRRWKAGSSSPVIENLHRVVTEAKKTTEERAA